MGVPSGSFVTDGISDWLGEIPVERGWRSKGSFCESAEFEALPPESLVGRPQAQMRLSISRTMARRPAWDGMNFSAERTNGSRMGSSLSGFGGGCQTCLGKYKQIGAIAAAKNADLVVIKPCPI
jgi:hypothetical protein